MDPIYMECLSPPSLMWTCTSSVRHCSVPCLKPGWENHQNVNMLVRGRGKEPYRWAEIDFLLPHRYAVGFLLRCMFFTYTKPLYLRSDTIVVGVVPWTTSSRNHRGGENYWREDQEVHDEQQNLPFMETTQGRRQFLIEDSGKKTCRLRTISDRETDERGVDA